MIAATRRKLFGFAAGLGATTLLPTGAGARAATGLIVSPETEFIQGAKLVWGAPGARAAEHAIAAGMRPDQLWIALDGGDEADLWPCLTFKLDGGQARRFRPNGE